MEKPGYSGSQINVVPFAFRRETGRKRAVHASLLAVFCLLSPGCTEAPKNCPNEVAAAFERLQMSGRPYRKETIVGAHHEISEILPPDRMRKIENKDYGMVETIRIGARAWTNEGQRWREFEPALVAAEVIARMGSSSRPDPVHASLAFDCLGKVAFKGRTYNGYRARFSAIVTIFSVTRPLSEKEKEKEEQELLSKFQQVPQTWRTVFVDWPSMLPAWDLVSPQNQIEDPSSSEHYTYPGYIWIEPPAL